MGKDAPKAPDPAALVNAQSQANRLNVISPTGNILFGKMGADGQFDPTPQPGQGAVQIYETPTQGNIRTTRDYLTQALLSGATTGDLPMLDRLPANRTAMGIEQSLPGTYNIWGNQLPKFADQPNAGLMNLRSSTAIEGALPSISTDFSGDASRVEQATFDRARGLLDPVYATQERRLQQQLADQGLPVGSEATGGEAYAGAMDVFNRGKNQAYNDAALQSVLAGRQEQERLARLGMDTRGLLFGEQMGLAGLESGQRGQLFGEQQTQYQNAAQRRAQMFGEQMGLFDASMQQRNQMFNEQAQLADIIDRRRGMNLQNDYSNLAIQQALASGSPVLPQQVNVPGVDVMAPYMNNYNQQMGQYNANMQGLGGLLGTGMMALAL